MNNPHNDPHEELKELKNLMAVLEDRILDKKESPFVIITEIERIKARLNYLKAYFLDTSKKVA